MSLTNAIELYAELEEALPGGIAAIDDLSTLQTAILIAFGQTEEKTLAGLPVDSLDKVVIEAKGITGEDIYASNIAPYMLLGQIIWSYVNQKLRDHDRDSEAHD